MRRLRHYGDEAAAGVVALANGSRDWRVRLGAVVAIAEIGGPDAYATIERRTRDRSRAVADEAAIALRRVADPRVVGTLIGLVCRAARSVRDDIIAGAAAESLVKLGPRVVEPLARALEEHAGAPRACGTYVMRWLASPASLAAIASWMPDPEPNTALAIRDDLSLVALWPGHCTDPALVETARHIVVAHPDATTIRIVDGWVEYGEHSDPKWKGRRAAKELSARVHAAADERSGNPTTSVP